MAATGFHTADELNALLPGTLPGLLGLTITAHEPGRLEAALDVRPELLAPNGYLHAATVIGLAGVMFAPTAAPYLWVVILGIGQGGAFGLALLLISVRTRSTVATARLSAQAHTVGYLLAAAGPLLGRRPISAGLSQLLWRAIKGNRILIFFLNLIFRKACDTTSGRRLI